MDDQYVVVDAKRDVPANHDSDDDFDESDTDDEADEDMLPSGPAPGSPAGGHKRRRRVRRRDGGDDSDDGDDDLERVELTSPSSAGAAKLTRAGRKRRWKQYYGRGSFRGLPVSHSMWQLVSQLHRERNDLLWLAIVGVTYSLLHGKLEAELYRDARQELERSVLMLNDPAREDAPGRVASSTAGSGNGPSLAGLPAALEGGTVHGAAPVFDENGELLQPAGAGAAAEVDPLTAGVSVMPAARLGHIRRSVECRFFLHRHTSLYEGMRLSPYLGPRMGFWVSDDDDMSLKALLASAGIPLKAAQQPFAHMPSTMKARVATRLVPLARDGPRALRELEYDSFTMQTGYAAPVSAADVAFATASLLEYAKTLTTSRAEEEAVAAVAARASAQAGAPQESTAGGRSSAAEVSWRDNFWVAFESLTARQPALLQQGLRLAMEVQNAILRLGPYVLRAKQHFTFNGAVRTCKIADLTETDRHIFTQPEFLLRLGRFVVDHHQLVKRQWNRSPGAAGVTSPAHIAKPLVMLALNADTSFYTVVGLEVASLDDAGASFSKLADVMRVAGDEAGARFVMDTFDSSVIWIHKDFVDAFVDQLCYRVVAGYETAAIAAGSHARQPPPPPPGPGSPQDDTQSSTGESDADGGAGGEETEESDGPGDGGSDDEDLGRGQSTVPSPAPGSDSTLGASPASSSAGAPTALQDQSLFTSPQAEQGAAQAAFEGEEEVYDEAALLALLDEVEDHTLV